MFLKCSIYYYHTPVDPHQHSILVNFNSFQPISVYLCPTRFFFVYSVHFGLLWSILVCFSPFWSIQSITVHFSLFGLLWSISVYFGSFGPLLFIQSTLLYFYLVWFIVYFGLFGPVSSISVHLVNFGPLWSLTIMSHFQRNAGKFLI